MRSRFIAPLGLLVGSALAAEYVWMCGDMITYADGGLYCKMGSNGRCGGDLGDFPAKKKFPLNLAVSNNGKAPMDPIQPAEQTVTHDYDLLSERLYIDKSAGAFAPMGFTADNTTLKDGQTTWGFFGGYGFLIFSPTGDAVDTGPADQAGGSMLVATQGYQLVETSTADVYQLYWNQTKHDEMRAGRYTASGFTFGICRGDMKPVLRRPGPKFRYRSEDAPMARLFA